MHSATTATVGQTGVFKLTAIKGEKAEIKNGNENSFSWWVVLFGNFLTQSNKAPELLCHLYSFLPSPITLNIKVADLHWDEQNPAVITS